MRKKLLLLLLVAVLASFTKPVSGAQKESGTAFNTPDELRACLRTQPKIEIYDVINPFYLSGDFDGDGNTDFAVQVITKQDKHHGVLFCFANGRTSLWGADIPNAILKDGSWPFDSWILVRKGSKHLSIYPKIKTDAIALIIADEGGGLLYWGGKSLVWQREE